jgi:hypothetical protein
VSIGLLMMYLEPKRWWEIATSLGVHEDVATAEDFDTAMAAVARIWKLPRKNPLIVVIDSRKGNDGENVANALRELPGAQVGIISISPKTQDWADENITRFVDLRSTVHKILRTKHTKLSKV